MVISPDLVMQYRYVMDSGWLNVNLPNRLKTNKPLCCSKVMADEQYMERMSPSESAGKQLDISLSLSLSLGPVAKLPMWPIHCWS